MRGEGITVLVDRTATAVSAVRGECCVVERGGERDTEQARDEQGGGPAVDPRERAHGRDDQHS